MSAMQLHRPEDLTDRTDEMDVRGEMDITDVGQGLSPVPPPNVLPSLDPRLPGPGIGHLTSNDHRWCPRTHRPLNADSLAAPWARSIAPLHEGGNRSGALRNNGRGRRAEALGYVPCGTRIVVHGAIADRGRAPGPVPSAVLAPNATCNTHTAHPVAEGFSPPSPPNMIPSDNRWFVGRASSHGGGMDVSPGDRAEALTYVIASAGATSWPTIAMCSDTHRGIR